jgi:RNA polymerase sigma-B factor
VLTRAPSADGTAPEPTGSTRRPAPDPEYAHLEPALAEFARLEPGSPRRTELREQLVLGFTPLAQHVAKRFAQRGVPLEDLCQVALIGLINALDRYQPHRAEGGLLAFAIPTISGEIRRYFRDRTWAMRVPRRLKELHLDITSATAELSGALGRSPRPSEIAARLDIGTDEVLEGLQAGQVYQSDSLDQHLRAGDDSASLGDLLGQADKRLELAEYRHALAPLLDQLPERERTILMLRFYAEQTQTQIAEQVGISQMHVSRLLSKTLVQLREQLLTDSPPSGTANR